MTKWLEVIGEPIFADGMIALRASMERRTPLSASDRQAINGGRDRDRTCDPYHVKVVLYR